MREMKASSKVATRLLVNMRIPATSISQIQGPHAGVYCGASYLHSTPVLVEKL